MDFRLVKIFALLLVFCSVSFSQPVVYGAAYLYLIFAAIIAITGLILGPIFAYISSYIYHKKVKGKGIGIWAVLLCLALLVSLIFLSSLTMWLIVLTVYVIGPLIPLGLGITIPLALIVFSFASHHVYKNIYLKTENQIKWFAVVLTLVLASIQFFISLIIMLLLI